MTATNGATVKKGDPLFAWIDCGKLLVDVPASETLATLMRPGIGARVVLEGDAEWRDAAVLFGRAAASRLRGTELASIPHVRNDGTAEIVVSLADPSAIGGCPVGRRAYVSFPEIGLFQYIGAYLPPL